jgi:hypothetical protein
MHDFQVVCPRCRVTFPVEQKRCLHCGGPLLPGGEAQALQSRTPRPLELELDPEELGDEARKPGASLRRGMLALWLLLALGGSLMRSCFD